MQHKKQGRAKFLRILSIFFRMIGFIDSPWTSPWTVVFWSFFVWQEGINVNQLYDQVTPLHRAVAMGHLMAAERLVATGAKVKQKDREGQGLSKWRVLDEKVHLPGN